MPTNVVVNGITYPVPLYGETGWAQGSGNLSQLLIALAAATATAPSFMTVTNVTVSPQTVATAHTYLVDTSGVAITLNLPTPIANIWFSVKDKTGNAMTNPIILHRHGSEKIDGTAADATLSAPFGSWGFFTDGTDWYSMFYA